MPGIKAPRLKAVIFDAYGTLLDVHSAMARHAAVLGPRWEEISQTWRTKQLEYSWIHSLAGEYRDFARLTREALAFAAAKHGVTDPALLTALEAAYRELTPYPDVIATLQALRERGLACAVLSNGETAMLDEGLRHAGLLPLLDAVLSVDQAGIFKPDPRVYRLATERFAAAPSELAFLSSNPWDAYGAHRFGFRVLWVNRHGQPSEYRLQDIVPVLDGLRALPDRLD